MAHSTREARPWLIHYFQRHPDDDELTPVPAMDFLDGLPPKIAAEFGAVLDAVAKAPPPAFSGGGKWEAMHGDMAGIYEARVRALGANHRLFCLLVRKGNNLGGPSIVCLGGLSKPSRSAANDRDYLRVKRYAEEFRKHQKVLSWRE